MTVNPSSTSPIAIPDPFAYPGNIPAGSIASPTQKSIFETFVNEGRGGIFQNPLTDAIGGLGDNLTQLYDIVNSSSCLSSGEKTTITNALGTGGVGGLSEQLSLFSTHVQILSGVIPQGTSSTPGLDRILSVGRSLGNLSNAIDGVSDCFSLLNSMTGLFSEELLNGYTGEIANMIAQVNNCLADAIAIADRLNEITNILQSIINSDRNFFQNSLDRLIQSSLSSLLESMYDNPCGKVLLERIGQDKLLGFLR